MSVSRAGHECCVGVTGRLQKTWGDVCGCWGGGDL